MTEPERANSSETANDDTEASESSSPVSSQGRAPGEAGNGEVAEAGPADRLAAAQAEAARLRDQLLRTAADFDNYRKRSRKEAEDAQRRGKEAALKELLPVFDNLERAAQHADSAPEAKSVADGLRIVLKQFVDTMGKLGIKRVTAVGVPFDPSVHEAIQHIESAEHPAGVVLAEIQPGYTMNDQLLRAALVVVSKGAPQAESVAS
jgi:molecular chaperone GrpE